MFNRGQRAFTWVWGGAAVLLTGSGAALGFSYLGLGRRSCVVTWVWGGAPVLLTGSGAALGFS